MFEEYEEKSMREIMKEIGMGRRIGVIMSRDAWIGVEWIGGCGICGKSS